MTSPVGTSDSPATWFQVSHASKEIRDSRCSYVQTWLSNHKADISFHAKTPPIALLFAVPYRGDGDWTTELPWWAANYSVIEYIVIMWLYLNVTSPRLLVSSLSNSRWLRRTGNCHNCPFVSVGLLIIRGWVGRGFHWLDFTVLWEKMTWNVS